MLKRASPLHKQFTLIWLLITAIVLGILLYINWHINQEGSNKNISEVALQLTNKLDRFIEDLYQDIYTIPFYEKKISNCKASLYPYLERINLNNPKISGIMASYKNKIICSTLSNNDNLHTATLQSRAILGPFKLSIFDQPVYIVQQKLGHYSIGMLVIASIIQKILHPSNDSPDTIALYDEIEGKYLIKIKYDPKHSEWFLNENLKPFAIKNYSGLLAQSRLHSINTIKVMVFENHHGLIRQLWYKELLLAPCILLFSYVLYLLINYLIVKYTSLLNAMKLAVKNKEFYPEYQPIFNKNTQKYSGAEVLLRWKKNEDIIIMPDFFIREAELTGIIIPITLQTIETSFQETKVILDKDPDFHLAFNVSALHFTDPQFFNEFNVLVDHYNIRPQQIIIEITERDLLDKNNDIFIEKMQQLRSDGFSLAVDDFGTGHASINYLQHFPFNYLKIDKLFIQAIGSKAITESLNDAIINMAKNLNLIIIAEGVETKEQFNYLTEHGVQLQQGWYFSKAVSIEQLINLVKGEKDDSLLL